MTQGTDRGGAPAETVADVGTSGDGSGVDEGPFLSIEEPQYQLVEWRQTNLEEWFDSNISTMDQAEAVGHLLLDVGEKTQTALGQLFNHVEMHKGGRGLEGGCRELGRRLNIRHGTYNLWMAATKTQKLVDRSTSLGTTKVGLIERALEPEAVWEWVDAQEEPPTKSEIRDRVAEQKIAAADPLMPLELRYFDVWNFQTRTPGQGWKGYEWGGVCGQLLENLLWYYTEPGDLVIDPMAGTGTTWDACERMKRKCLAYDKYPTRPEIMENDITAGLPRKASGAALVYLDPPYFTMKKNEFRDYSHFLGFLMVCVKAAHDALKDGGHIALIFCDITNKGEKNWPLIGDAYTVLKSAGLVFERLIAAPLTSQQYSGYNIESAKEKRTMLGINRQMWIFRRPGP